MVGMPPKGDAERRKREAALPADPTYAAVYRGVLADPADALRRQVLADRAEELDCPELAGELRGPFLGCDLFGDLFFAAGDGARSVGGRDGLFYRQRNGLRFSLRCKQRTFFRHAAAVFGRHPVTRVEFMKAVPAGRYRAGGDARYSWTTVKNLTLADPHDVSDRLKLCGRKYGPIDAPGWWFYETDLAALRDLSRAAVAYGRELAGLPPIDGEPPR